MDRWVDGRKENSFYYRTPTIGEGVNVLNIAMESN